MGSPLWFAELAEYRYEKLDYLPRVARFDAFRDRRVLEIGAGVGLDSVRFGKGGARVTATEIAPRAAAVLRRALDLESLPGNVVVADGQCLPFDDASFDHVYCQGVLPFVAEPADVVAETHRVLAPGGSALFMLYHRHSWLWALSRLTGVALANADAPIFRTFDRRQTRALFAEFDEVTITTERFPVATRLYQGWKRALFNGVFVGAFNALPHAVVGRFGWHLLVALRKAPDR